MSDHSTFSPSGAEKWFNCSGALLAEKAIPDRGSDYAKEGTLAHLLGENCLKHDYSALKIREIAGQEVPTDMNRPVQDYVDAVRSMTQGYSFIEYELTADLSEVLQKEGEKGTADVAAIVGTELQIHDLKYGKGVEVYAEENKQLKLYALGALDLVEMFAEIEQVRLVIHMPRKYGVSEWVTTPQELREFQEEARKAVKLASELLNGERELTQEDLNPGKKQCQWCRAKATCLAFQKWVERTVMDEFEDLTEESIDYNVKVSDADILARSHSAIPAIKLWIKAVDDEIYRRMMEGEEVPGLKLVKGKSAGRKWADAELSEEFLKTSLRLKIDQMYEKKLLSPAKLEKIIAGSHPKKWKKIQDYITMPEGKPTVVSITDKRPAIEIQNNIVNEFENLEEKEVSDAKN